MSDYASLDGTLMRRNPAMPNARLQVKKAAPEAVEKEAKFIRFIEELISLTRLSRALVADCVWEMIDAGDISLDSHFYVKLRPADGWRNA
jgi:hypothetical protein